MLRSTLTGAAVLALISSAACAQEEITPDATAQLDAETSIHINAAVLDAAHVTTREDAQSFAQAEFIQADLNQDGAIDINEFVAYATVKTPLNDPAINETAQAELEAQGDADGPATAEEQFAELSQGDESITETEIVEARIADFEAADVDNDETLDDTERQQFAALAMPKRPSTSSL